MLRRPVGLRVRGVFRVRKATAFGLAAACAGSLALAGAVGVPAASADSVRDGQLWALNMMDVQQAWDQGNEGQGVTVAVLDSGVTPDVSDLTGSVVSGTVVRSRSRSLIRDRPTEACW